MSDYILEVSNLTKNYGDIRALDSINLNIEKGKIYGLLGPNGAGKTTFLRIVNNLLTFDSGSILINGEPASFSTAKYLGYLPEERGLYDNMRVDEQILFFGKLRGGERTRLQKVMKEYMEIFNLTADSHRKIKELSKGNQQKVQIVATLVHEPDLVMLDEPFSGFDPLNGALLANLIDRLQSQGATIMLSSHNMPAVEEICSDITMINKGKVLLSGTLSDIKEIHKEGKYFITLDNKYSPKENNCNNTIKEISTAHNLPGRSGFSYLIEKNPDVSRSELIRELSEHNEILLFEEKLPTLNEIFIKYAQ